MLKFQKMNFFWKAPLGTIDLFSSKDLLSILYSIKSILIWKKNKTFFLNIEKVIWKQKQVHYLWNTLYNHGHSNVYVLNDAKNQKYEFACPSKDQKRNESE